jgi:membrane protease YdiL (CAAX protease family)
MEAREVLVLGVLFQPPIETLLFQFLTIEILSFFTPRKAVLILISSLVFALAHSELLTMLIVIPPGVILAWSYLLKRRKSKLKAFLITTAIHSLGNLLSLWVKYFI